MQSSVYWAQRFERLNAALLAKGDEFYRREIIANFRRAQREIEKEIAKWCNRLAANNGLDLATAKELLRRSELAEFRWTLADYIRHGKENGISADWRKELENASAKAHITRLEAILTDLRQQVEIAYGLTERELGAGLGEIYTDGYYRTGYELARGTGVGAFLDKVDITQLNAVLAEPWVGDGLNYSRRLWRDKDAMIKALTGELTQGFMHGTPPGEMVDRLASKLNASVSNVGRLVMTESAYFATKGQMDCFAALEVEEYEYIATLDGKTSEICQSLDGKHFALREMRPGTNAPPMHCWCRSCTAPYFKGGKGTRAARNPDTGKTEQVPASMKYADWKRVFVDRELTLNEWGNTQ